MFICSHNDQQCMSDRFLRSSMKSLRLIVILLMTSYPVFAQENLYQFRAELSAANNSSVQSHEVSTVSKKSPVMAVVYSLLLPGMGELYADGFSQGRYSLIAEGGLWMTYFSFRQYGAWIQNDSRNFAASHAGAQVNGKDDQYFVNIGNFGDTYEYNEKKLRDRELAKVYDVNAGYAWKWDSDASRKEFRTMRVSSERVLNNSRFVIASIVVNRVISAINAARLTRMFNQRVNDELGSWWIESSLINEGLKPDGMKLSIVHRF